MEYQSDQTNKPHDLAYQEYFSILFSSYSLLFPTDTADVYMKLTVSTAALLFLEPTLHVEFYLADQHFFLGGGRGGGGGDRGIFSVRSCSYTCAKV